jgi:enoyl-CoA hydratase/carnithine racemase
VLGKTSKGIYIQHSNYLQTNLTRSRWLNRPVTENDLHEHGFGGISARKTLTKPLIAAVNGLAFGGGTELILNCDLVIASEDAKFALPEVSRGVVAAQGGIPRLAKTAGHQVSRFYPTTISFPVNLYTLVCL